MKTRFRFYFKQLGGHIHIRVFATAGQGDTFGKCGDLTMAELEFADFRKMMESLATSTTVEPVEATFIPEEAN